MRDPKDMTDEDIADQLRALRHVGGDMDPGYIEGLRGIGDRMRELRDEQERRKKLSPGLEKKQT